MCFILVVLINLVLKHHAIVFVFEVMAMKYKFSAVAFEGNEDFYNFAGHYQHCILPALFGNR